MNKFNNKREIDGNINYKFNNNNNFKIQQHQITIVKITISNLVKTRINKLTTVTIKAYKTFNIIIVNIVFTKLVHD